MNEPPPLHTEMHDDILVVTLEADEVSRTGWHGSWSEHLDRLPARPLRQLILDMSKVQLTDSTFFAGALHLLERLRNEQLDHIVLRNAPASVIETIAIMKLDHLFRIENDRHGKD